MAGESLGITRFPLPYRMNVDLSPSLIKDEDSPYLLNVNTSEPGQIRPRYGMATRNYVSQGLPPTESVFQFAPFGSKALFWSYSSSSAASWVPYYFVWPGASQPSTVGMKVLDVSTSTYTQITSAAFSTLFTPFGKTIVFDNSLIGASAARISRTLGTSVGGATFTMGGLMRWGGATASGSGSLTASVTNGSAAVTLSAPYGTSLTGMLMRVPATAAPYDYLYRVSAHTAGTAAVTLDRAYGLGEPTANVPTNAAATVEFNSFDYIQNSPGDPACVGLYLNRVFVGRGWVLTPTESLYGYYNNLIAWSDVHTPERWPATSQELVGDNPDDPIMAFATMKDGLLIFTREKCYKLMGQDEDSFNIKLLFDIGCIYSGSVCNYNDAVIWLSKYGVHMYDGYELTELSKLAPDDGIRTLLRADLERGPYLGDIYAWRLPTTMVYKDRLLLTIYDVRHGTYTPGYAWTFHFPTQSWSLWGNAVDSGNRQPVMVGMVNGRAIAVGRYQFWDVSDCWGPERTDNVYTDYLDTVLDSSSGTLLTRAFAWEVQTKSYLLSDGWTIQVRDLEVQHTQQQNLASANHKGWDISYATDPNMEDYTALTTITTRSDAALDHTRLYSDRYVGSTFPSRASAIKFKLSALDSRSTTTERPPISPKIVGIYATVDNDRQLRVDNPVVS